MDNNIDHTGRSNECFENISQENMHTCMDYIIIITQIMHCKLVRGSTVKNKIRTYH